MPQLDEPDGWETQSGGSKERFHNPGFSQSQPKAIRSSLVGRGPDISEVTDSDLWSLWSLEDIAGAANLDDQKPETLYYLGQIAQIPTVQEVYVENRESGDKKHWAVLSERDFEDMDWIYDIEQDVLDRFPGTNVQFRVTVQSEGGPSVASKATKIYSAD